VHPPAMQAPPYCQSSLATTYVSQQLVYCLASHTKGTQRVCCAQLQRVAWWWQLLTWGVL
jgi:hypothetical protein